MKTSKLSWQEPETPLSEEEVRSFTSWKLDLLKAINGDPTMNGSHLKIVEAYLHFVNAQTRSAYLSVLTLKALTNLSQPTITKCLAELQRHGVFTATGRTTKGCIWYKVQNARESLVLDHLTLKREHLGERDADRKAGQRRLRNARRSTKETLVTNTPLHQRNLGDSTKDSYDKHLEGTPVYPDSSEGGARSQADRADAYLRASRGG